MAKITNETISKIKNPNELLDFLSLNIYEEENCDVRENNEIPEYIKNIIYIIDFETEYEMEGILFTETDNIYYKMDKIIESFDETGNKEIANYIKEIMRIKKVDNNDDKKEELENKIETIILEKEFWGNVVKYIELNKK
jgi:hypothetical protein